MDESPKETIYDCKGHEEVEHLQAYSTSVM